MRKAVESKWVCDMCGKEAPSPHADRPSGWYDVELRWPNRSCAMTLDTCDECYVGGMNYISAKSFLGRVRKWLFK